MASGPDHKATSAADSDRVVELRAKLRKGEELRGTPASFTELREVHIQAGHDSGTADQYAADGLGKAEVTRKREAASAAAAAELHLCLHGPTTADQLAIDVKWRAHWQRVADKARRQAGGGCHAAPVIVISRVTPRLISRVTPRRRGAGAPARRKTATASSGASDGSDSSSDEPAPAALARAAGAVATQLQDAVLEALQASSRCELTATIITPLTSGTIAAAVTVATLALREVNILFRCAPADADAAPQLTLFIYAERVGS